ncbi:MAG: DUF445 family protein [Victivallaceae bacterium]|nr:DUF445 family protein [Victivallaceae bacterium]
MTPESLSSSSLPFLDRLCRAASFLTLAAAVLCGVLRRTAGLVPGTFVAEGVLPVLTAAAVGYLTNFAAIALLFRPYRPVRWLKNLQGIVPKEQPRLAAQLGEEITENLLPPESLAEELCAAVSDHLQAPGLVPALRAQVRRYAVHYRRVLAAALSPVIEETLFLEAEKMASAGEARKFFDDCAGPWLTREAEREENLARIVAEASRRAPDIAAAVRRFLRDGAREYMQSEHPALCRFARADEIAAQRVMKWDWAALERKIAAAIASPATKYALRRELTMLGEKLREYVHSEEFATMLSAWRADREAAARSLLRRKLEEVLPESIVHIATDGRLWRELESQWLPSFRRFVLHRIRREKERIAARFDLSGRIEAAVLAQSPEKLHELVNEVSGKHLVLLQLLGYVLGGAAGFILIFAR